jgi:hypothetical protein
MLKNKFLDINQWLIKLVVAVAAVPITTSQTLYHAEYAKDTINKKEEQNRMRLVNALTAFDRDERAACSNEWAIVRDSVGLFANADVRVKHV